MYKNNKYRKHNSTSTEVEQASLTHPKRKAQYYMPDVVYNHITSDAFRKTATASWKVPTTTTGVFKQYRASVEKQENGDKLLVCDYLGLVNANGQQIVTTTTPTSTMTPVPVLTPTLAGEIASIQALGLDAVTTKTCIDAVVKKYSG
jgi:hypothetical protein